MKKLLTLLIVIIALANIGKAQDVAPAAVWAEPEFFKVDEPVSWFFDLTGTALEGERSGVYYWTWTPTEPDAGNWENSSAFAGLVYVEGEIWRLDLTPTEYYGVAANQITTDGFWGLLKTQTGSKVSAAFNIQVPVPEPVLPPELVYFPQKITQRDILCIFRYNNESGITLNYEITAGNKTLTGDFTGSEKQYSAYLNLADELKSEPALDKIHVVIRNNNGDVISDIDITLEKTDE